MGLAILAQPAAAQTVEPQQGQAPPTQATLGTLNVSSLTGDVSPAAAGAIRFKADLNYKLATPSGALAMYIFENDAEQASMRSPTPIQVAGGPGAGTLWLDYTPQPGVDTLSVMVGLFDPAGDLVSWAASPPFALQPWPGKQAFENAMMARVGHDYEAALGFMDQALTASPETGEYHYWRADSLAHLGRYGEALPEYDTALAAMPEDRIVRVGRDVALLWLGNLDESVADLTALIDTDVAQDRWTAWEYRARGLAREALGQADGAIADFQAYLTLSPTATDRDEVQGRITALGG
jgi:tetratricopeptide (TPR) repeat protein